MDLKVFFLQRMKGVSISMTAQRGGKNCQQRVCNQSKLCLSKKMRNRLSFAKEFPPTCCHFSAVLMCPRVNSWACVVAKLISGSAMFSNWRIRL
uniref:p2C26 n=1 Tax=Arundo donax TaxID=35708 RepID=A0A0A8ZKI4_ARUDO